MAMPSLRSFWLVLAAGLVLAMPAIAQAPVGRISEASGPVSLRPPGGGWVNVGRGAALSEGQTLRTGGRSQAELDLGVNRIGLDPGTVLRIDSGHPGMPAVTLEQGRAMLLVRSLQPGQVARVVMPRGSVTLAAPGLYVIEAGEAGGPATIGVSRGMAQAYGPGVSLMVSAGQTGVIGGPDGRPASLRAGVADGFLADDATMPGMPQVVRPAMLPPQGGGPYDEVAELPGGEALLRDGSWVSNPEYGQVWYPPVTPGWSPYADAWDEDRGWGYTPWHYGSWIQIGPRWGWLPPPRRQSGPGYGYRPGRPPPAVAQPHRPPPFFGPPQGYGGGYGGGRPPGPPSHVGPPQAYGGGRPAGPYQGPPPVFGGPRPAPPPPVFAPRGAPVAAPPGAPPQIFAPRPSAGPPISSGPPPPSFLAQQRPPMAAPRAAAPAPSRRCGPFQAPC